MIARGAPLMVMLLLPAFVLPMPADAARDCAASSAPVRVKIKSDPGKVIFKLDHGRADLRRLQRGNTKGRIASDANPLGLTLTDFRFSIKTTVKLRPLAGGRHCATPESFDLNIGYSDFVVYIDRRYKRGSCEYRAIRDHENTHVSLYRAYLSRHLPALRRQAKAAARRIKPTRVGNPDAGATYIQNQMQSRITPIIDRIGREADAANARIDAPRSYRDVQLLCDNW